MTTISRTNMCTNPSFEAAAGTIVVRKNLATTGAAVSTTNWGAYGGTGGTAALSNQTSGGAFGSTFNRVTWSVATTAPSGGLTYIEPSGLVASQAYAIQMWVRSSKAQTIGLTAQFLNASGTIINTAFGSNVSVAANTWTQVTVTGTSGAAVTQVKLTAQPPAGSPNWASGDTLDGDGVCIETGATVGTYFDGSTATAGDYSYGWNGTANASTSNQTAPGVASINFGGGGIGYQSTAWKVGGNASLRVAPLGTSGYVEFNLGSSTLAPGATYTLLGTSYTTAAAQSGGRVIAIRAYGSTTTFAATSAATAGTMGTYAHVATFTVPTDATAIGFRFIGDAAGGTDVWFDNIMLIAGTAAGTYFDGNTPAVNNLAYQWTGTANASTSQEYYALPTVLTVAKTDAPCPRTEVTVVGLGTGTTVFNVWRTADGKRKAVRGARNRSGVDSDFVVDYEAPLNRSLTYDIEVISGSQVTQPTYPATVTVLSSTWWIQDPLVPSSAIPLNVSKQDSNAPYLTGNAIKSLEYGASVTLIPILGSTDPVALMGNRTIAGNVTFDMFTNLASVTTQLRNLIQQTPLLLIRSTGTRNNGIPGLAYFTSAKPSEKPVTVAFGGTLTNWSLTGDLVAAPTMNVLVPIWTYGTVAALWTTYQQAQTTLAAKTYLDVLKSPAGT